MKTKKIIILIITMMILANSLIGLNISKASTDNQILTIKKGTEYGDCLKEGNATLRFFRTYYEGNGGIYPVYCFDKSKPGVEAIPEGEYQIQVSNKITDERLWRIIVNSYPFKEFTEMGCDTPAQAYIATKAAIDCILYDKNISDFSYINDSGKTILKAIETLLEYANNETIHPVSTDIEIVPMDEWKLENVSGKLYLSRNFNVENNYLTGRYTVGLRGDIPRGSKIVDKNNNPKLNFHKTENFKVLIPSEQVNSEDTITISATGDVTTLPIYNGTPFGDKIEYQNYIITGIRSEIGEGEGNIKYAPIGGTLIITKTDSETKQKLEGAIFNVYDSNNKLLYENLKTDENGEIKIYNLLTDKYYIKEIKAPDGYNLIEQQQEIQVYEGSTSNMFINNSKTIITEEEKHNIIVEIVENNKENHVIIENEYHKQETNNNTNTYTEINNNYIDKTNNNNIENTVVNNNTIKTTENNETKANNKTTNNNIISENNIKDDNNETNENISNTKNTTTNQSITKNISNNKKLPKTGM